MKDIPVEQRPLRSPLRFPGGKIRVASKLLVHAPPVEAIVQYREPLCGGAALFFRRPKAAKNWLNDSHPGLIAFFTALRDYPDEFLMLLRNRLVLKSKSEAKRYAYYRRQFDAMVNRRDLMGAQPPPRMKEPTWTLTRAFQFYVINRCSWGGRVIYDPDRACRLYFSNPAGLDNLPKKLEHLRLCSEKLQGVKLTCGDFAKCLTGLPPKMSPMHWTLIYLDPPYHRDTRAPTFDRLYDQTFTMKDHARLRKALKRIHGRAFWMLSYGDCPEVRALYAGHRMVQLKWKYSGRQAVTAAMKKKGEKEVKVTGNELLVLNYSF